MPRLTIIYAEQTFREDKASYEGDPGNFRSPEDYCNRCFQHIYVDEIAHRNHISYEFALAQVNDEFDEGLKEDCHPDYDGGEYHCVQCGAALTDEDN